MIVNDRFDYCRVNKNDLLKNVEPGGLKTRTYILCEVAC